MGFQEELRRVLEREELETVGSAFGGSGSKIRKQFSIASIRKWVLDQKPFGSRTPIERSLQRASQVFEQKPLEHLINNLVRFSFLIELTKLDLGSTQMKTRWVPGRILKAQEGSFEPVEGEFSPGNDPRAARFEQCVAVFVVACEMACNELTRSDPPGRLLLDLDKHHSVPYEFPLTYRRPQEKPVHMASNVAWAKVDDLQWLIEARRILRACEGNVATVFRTITSKKFEVKVYKTDRALTGKDKSNRAKRWEVLADDFQHATLEDCWSAERKLAADFVCFEGFPESIRDLFVERGLISFPGTPTRCPITLESLSFRKLAEAILEPTHGVSEYQIGHLKPLKRRGKHRGDNVCWQSADGNRMQGELTIEETHRLIREIAHRLDARVA